jgi:hypothetical protein
MGYGVGEYGQRGYGGSSFEEGGPSLISSDPPNGSSGWAEDVPVTFVVESPAGLDPYSLGVTVEGAQAIVGGVFQAGYTGTVVYDPETSVTVIIATHPAFSGVIPVNISIKDLAGIAATPSFSFESDIIVGVNETLTLSENLTLVMDGVESVGETLTLSDSVTPSRWQLVEVSDELSQQVDLETGTFQILTLDGNTLRVYFSSEVRFDQVSDLANYSVVPLDEDAVSIILESVEIQTETYQSGTTGYAYAPPVDLGFSDHTDTFLVEGATLGLENIGDYLEIKTGCNQGIYQIENITSVGGVPAVVLDREIAVGCVGNGYTEGFAEVVGAGTMTFRLNSSEVSVSDPLVEVLYVYNRTKGLSYTLSSVSFLDHETFQITPTASLDATDRVYVFARVTPKVEWQHISGVQGVEFATTKFTDAKLYAFSAENLVLKNTGVPVTEYGTFTSQNVDKPKLSSVSADAEGIVTVTYDQAMRLDGSLFNTGDYEITGGTTVVIRGVRSVSDKAVALLTAGMEVGNYTLEVNATGTPKDIAGNPIDPSYNSAIFSTTTPQTARSVFTDRGPIAKPPLTIQSGTGGTIETFTEVTIPGASLTSSHIGKLLTLSGSINGGTYKITGIVSSVRARVQASFTLPDTTSLTWELFDPRDGQVADDPADVTVLVNSAPVTPDAVVGLLGQVVLPTIPAPADDVKIDYSWVLNPVVEVRRLNSKEFRLNSWNRDVGYPKTGHSYRYNNVLVTPSDYEPDDPSATLDAPELRELHYRAYERAYTAVLNDPNLMLLNSPTHRIAYPPPQRTLSEEFVIYEALGLPENDTVNPWTRVGVGTTTASAGVLTVENTTSGTFPDGDLVFWTRPLDLTFPHVFAMSWRFLISSVTTYEGVFSGVAVGYSDDKFAAVVGFLEVGGVKQVGFLKRGATDPSDVSSWVGASGVPADFDWGVLHSYRLYRDTSGVVNLFVDGEVTATLQIASGELPFLEEVVAPFDEIQGAFFGSLSRPSENVSEWDFVRYLVLPTNPLQTSPSSFVSYEANVVPENDPKPWTPVGAHGTETILSTDYLLLDSTSATDSTTAGEAGLVGGDFRGFFRAEPLLRSSSQFVLDVGVQLRTQTHGPSPSGLMTAIDDGNYVVQLSIFPDQATPKICYGGRSLPEDFSPYAWTALGGATAEMTGRILQITDSSSTDGKVYSYDDLEPVVSDDRVVASTIDYILEYRCEVISYTVDGSGFAGVFAQAFDGVRAVGIQLEEISSVKYVTFQSDGVPIVAGRFAFDWGDGEAHTYRASKNTSGDLVSLFVDGVFVGSLAYSLFASPVPDPIGQLSFGSSTPASSGALSVVNWSYCNAWRLRSDLRHYIGLWKGSNDDSLLGYHLPLKTSGKGGLVSGNALSDGNADFLAATVVAGDLLVVDTGDNQGVYEVASVVGSANLTIIGTWPSSPSQVDYRIAKETDWTAQHKIRLSRDSSGEVMVLLDSDTSPVIRVSYNSLDLPSSGSGVVKSLSNGLPAVVFGSFDAENLEQSSWDFVRYGITRSVTELRIAPHHQILNQRNVMASPGHLFTSIPHDHTDYWSSSTGIPPKKDPDFFENTSLSAYTQLNDTTPLAPSTQSFEVRKPYPTQEFISALNRPEDVLNNDGDFVINDGALRFALVIPNDVLYTSLDVIERSSGEISLLAPFDDAGHPSLIGLEYLKEVCLEYTGDVLPEDDSDAPTPWQLVSDAPGEVLASVFSGILTYGTSAIGTKTVYRNSTPLPDAPGLQSEAIFRIKLLSDSTSGTGDSQVRFGLSAPGLTVALAFVTSPLAERLVLVVDLNNEAVLGSVTFDYLDGNFHSYRILRDPGAGNVQISIDA